jgi:ornithine cyclodeaminase/alanine dehydrogenase-like protein (mu-crystallin family)
VLLLSEDEIRHSTTMTEAVDAVEAAFAALARGEARLPDVIYLDLKEFNGEVHVKGAHLRGAPYYVFKVASGFYDNPAKGLPVGAGMVMAFEAATGKPAALLLDNGYLTDLRTGAAGAVAARHLARPSLSKLALVGAGLEARFQLRGIREVRELPPVAVWSRTEARARGFAEEMGDELGTAEVEVAGSLEEAVRDADLVITATPARAPLLDGSWLAEGACVVAIGSDGPEKRELDAEVFRRAGLVVCDVVEQCLRKGELHHAVDDGVADPAEVLELGDVVLGRAAGRGGEDLITVCDLTGTGVQDAAAAALALDGAKRLGMGRQLEA